MYCHQYIQIVISPMAHADCSLRCGSIGMHHHDFLPAGHSSWGEHRTPHLPLASDPLRPEEDGIATKPGIEQVDHTHEADFPDMFGQRVVAKQIKLECRLWDNLRDEDSRLAVAVSRTI